MTYNENNLNQFWNCDPEINTENNYNEDFFVAFDEILNEFDQILEELSNNT